MKHFLLLEFFHEEGRENKIKYGKVYNNFLGVEAFSTDEIRPLLNDT